jgi:cytoskeletal protein RodZ
MHRNPTFNDNAVTQMRSYQWWQNRRVKLIGISLIVLIIVVITLSLILKFVVFAPKKSEPTSATTTITSTSSVTTEVYSTTVPETTSTTTTTTTTTTTQQLGRSHSIALPLSICCFSNHSFSERKSCDPFLFHDDLIIIILNRISLSCRVEYRWQQIYNT